MANKIDFSLWSMELLDHLKSINDERQHDAEFINARVDFAAAAFEEARHDGKDPGLAMEVAHAALMEGFQQDSEV